MASWFSFPGVRLLEAVLLTWQHAFSKSLRLWQEALLSPTATKQAGNSHDKQQLSGQRQAHHAYLLTRGT